MADSNEQACKMVDRRIKYDCFARDGNKCCKCEATEDLTLDHIIPRSFNITSDELENLQILCKVCNVEKGQRIEVYTRSAEAIKFVKSQGFKLAKFYYHINKIGLHAIDEKGRQLAITWDLLKRHKK